MEGWCPKEATRELPLEGGERGAQGAGGTSSGRPSLGGGAGRASRDPASRGYVGHREGCGRPFVAVGSFRRVLGGNWILFAFGGRLSRPPCRVGAGEAWLRDRARWAARILWTRGEGKPMPRCDRAYTGPGPLKHTAAQDRARGPRLESLTSHPNTAKPRPVCWRSWGWCPHSRDAHSTAEVMAKECQGLWETEQKSGLARGCKLSGLNPPTRLRRGPGAPLLHVPTAESDGGPGLPSPGPACTLGGSLCAVCGDARGSRGLSTQPRG